MAIRADQVAFLDLGEDLFPRRVQEFGNAGQLFPGDVVKIHSREVETTAAIGARLRLLDPADAVPVILYAPPRIFRILFGPPPMALAV